MMPFRSVSSDGNLKSLLTQAFFEARMCAHMGRCPIPRGRLFNGHWEVSFRTPTACRSGSPPDSSTGRAMGVPCMPRYTSDPASKHIARVPFGRLSSSTRVARACIGHAPRG